MNNFNNLKSILLAIALLVIFVNKSYAKFDKRGMARTSISIESGVSLDQFNINRKDDSQYYLNDPEGHHTAIFENSWEDLKVFKNKINLNIPIFKISNNSLILQAYGAYGEQFSGNYLNTVKYYPVSTTANYSSYDEYVVYDEIDYSSYDLSVNLAYQIPLSPEGKNRDYYLLNTKVHSFLLPKLGYNYFRQDLSYSSFYDYSSNSSDLQRQDYTDEFSANWHGPFIALDLVNYLGQSHKILFGANINYLFYEINANIASQEALLRAVGINDFSGLEDLLVKTNNSLQGEANGIGFGLDVRYSYMPGANLSYDFNINYHNQRITDGDMTYYLRDDSSDLQDFNESNWESLFFSLGLTYNF